MTGSTSCRVTDDDSLKGIFCAQVVEHLITPELEQLIRPGPREAPAGWGPGHRDHQPEELVRDRGTTSTPTPPTSDRSTPRRCATSVSRSDFASVELEERSPHPLLGADRRTSRRPGGGGGGRAARKRVRASGLRHRRHQVIEYRAVHQFHSGTAVGDAITNQMFQLQRLLRELGFESEIFAEHIAPGLQDRIRSIHGYGGSESDLLLLHHSMGYDAFDDVISLPNDIVTVYHNVTPEQYFDERGHAPSHPARARTAHGARPPLAVRRRRLQLQPARDAGRRIPPGRGAAGPGRLQRVRRCNHRDRHQIQRLALCRADRREQVPARPGHRLRPLPPDLRSGGAAAC